ncbi:SET and MYND domain-containing protein DDB_G0273589-like [Ochlerotatus camptorhynchus]|uniref:SET and MYND domain-containing protein DDB_G0273589-like n=1 Tax=Ochlerotatus camptorhynchus TaxID=644619 RepID=UPI0031DC5C88
MDLLQQLHRLNRKPMSNYTVECFNRAPHLQNADVIAYRTYVLKNGPFIDESVAADLLKSNKKASEVRLVGNRLFLAKDSKAALEKYNESICWAEGNSEDLGIGYANRSAIYYDMEEYELSLHNIELAKKHSYPQRLMPKLLARELNCKEKITNGHSKRVQRCLKLAMNVEVNPKRPFMAAGIEQKELPSYGRSMVAERAFKAGDVILQEQAILTSISPELKFKNCNHCSVDNFHSLIPCPNCVSVMYCSVECLEKGLKFSHRFECGIAEKLHHISYGSSRIFMGTRAFFYGLTLFNDDVQKMMEYCKANDRTGADPFTLDYTDYDPLEEFKIFHKAKLPTNKFLYEDSFRFYAAVYYSIYIKHPLVRSIVTTRAQKDFMLHSFLDYMRIIGFLIIGPRQNFTNQLYSIASVCNHSCDPNTAAATYFGQLKFIAIRPISKGDQILVSYGPLAREYSDNERRQAIKMYHFNCLCDACNVVQLRCKLSAAKKLPPIPYKHLITVQKLIEDPNTNDAGKLNMLQQFAERYVYAHPRNDYVVLLDIYRELLLTMFTKEVQDQLRAKANQLA